jgi:cytochrome P450
MTRLPPGPARLGPIDFLRSSLHSPVPVLRRLAREHGHTFRVGTASGPLTVTGDPEAIRTLYTADPDSFDVWGADVAAPIFGRHGVVVTRGAQHRRDRKLLSAPFHAALRGYGAAIAGIAAEVAAGWPTGRPFSMLAATQDIALDIIIRVVFSVEGGARIRAVRAAVLRLIHAMSPLVFVFPGLRRDLFGLGPWSRLLRARDALDALLLEEIRARRSAAPGRERQDILSLLVAARDDEGEGLGDAELLDQLRTLLFAGHETTAVALAWALCFLHRHPAALARVRAEIDALGPEPDPEALAALPYLDAVCQETLRLCPPVVDVGRIVRRPFALGDYVIPAGEGISASPLLLHSREDLYPDPDRFRPERFLERKPSPFEFIAFGGGARRCLGAAFAMLEMKVTLGTLLRGCRLRLAPGAPTAHVRRGLTLGPQGSVPMIMEAPGRSPAHARA